MRKYKNTIYQTMTIKGAHLGTFPSTYQTTTSWHFHRLSGFSACPPHWWLHHSCKEHLLGHLPQIDHALHAPPTSSMCVYSSFTPIGGCFTWLITGCSFTLHWAHIPVAHFTDWKSVHQIKPLVSCNAGMQWSGDEWVSGCIEYENEPFVLFYEANSCFAWWHWYTCRNRLNSLRKHLTMTHKLSYILMRR